MEVSRFDVLLVALDPAVGSETRKSRPCVVVSPQPINDHLRTVIVAPMTSKLREAPTRIPCRFAGRAGQIVLHQIRAVDRSRVLRRLGRIDPRTATRVLGGLQEMFAP